MVNETQLTPRQLAILDLLGVGPSTRRQIQIALLGKFRVSKPTSFRDLKKLIADGLVIVTGQGKSTTYSLAGFNTLLQPPQKNSSIASSSFNFDVFPHLNNLLTPWEIGHLDTIHQSLNGQIEKLNQTIARKELERFVIELAWKSSQIEGNTYSLLETETLIKLSQEAPGHTKQEAVMILNHKAAFETIFHHRQDFLQLDFSDITQLHNTLIRNLGVEPGIRQHPVGITGSSYHPPDNQWQIKEAMEKMVKSINSSPHPLEKALIAAVMIAYIQPFADGNKRTSRMLANALLMARDYYPVSYRGVSETDYKQALIYFYEQNSILEFKQMFIGQYEYSLANYFRTNT